MTLERHDIYDPVGKDERRFGSVVLSEILEHLEDPVGALRAAAAWMRPGAWLWVNVPVNSPAPDHIFLLRTPEEAVELVRTAGFTPVDTAFYPMTGRDARRGQAGKADDLGHRHREAVKGRLGPPPLQTEQAPAASEPRGRRQARGEHDPEFLSDRAPSLTAAP